MKANVSEPQMTCRNGGGLLIGQVVSSLQRYGPLTEHSYTSADGPLEAISAALESLLEPLASDRPLARLLFVQADSAGPQVQARHTRLYHKLAAVLARDLREPGGGVASSLLAAKAMVGAIFEAIRSRLLPASAPRLIELHGPLMSTVVACYLGVEQN